VKYLGETETVNRWRHFKCWILVSFKGIKPKSSII